MEPTLVQKLLNELKCFCCAKQLKPPLIQCDIGHHFCPECREEFETCYNCQTPVGNRRDYLLEKMCFESVLKCSYSARGCTSTGIAMDVAEHEKSCRFSSAPSSSQQGVSGGLKPNGNNQAKGRSLDELFLDELECCICLTRMSLPIRECHNNHRMCGCCFSQVEICPVCEGPKVFSANIILERFYRMLEMTCSFSEFGCTFRGTGAMVAEHHRLCPLMERFCPLAGNSGCKFRGYLLDVVNHCRSHHPAVLRLQAENMYVHFLFSDSCMSVNTTYVYGALFRLSCVKSGNYVRFFIQCLGYMGNRYRFNFELAFVMNNMISRYVLLADGSATIHIQQLLPYCNNQYALRYMVRIT